MSLRDGTDARLPIRLYDEPVELVAGQSVERPVVPLKPLLPQPVQPPGYAPDRAMAVLLSSTSPESTVESAARP